MKSMSFITFIIQFKNTWVDFVLCIFMYLEARVGHSLFYISYNSNNIFIIEKNLNFL